MKYVLVVLAVVILGGTYFFVTIPASDKASTDITASSDTISKTDETVPEGMHIMPDNTLMDDTALMEDDMDTQTDMVIDPNAKVFTVSGTNFEFDVKEIRVQKGDTVTINFESADGFHDWVLDEFEAATDQVQPGTPTSVTFVAETAGTYEYYCSVGQHRANGMVGTLIVE